MSFKRLSKCIQDLFLSQALFSSEMNGHTWFTFTIGQIVCRTAIKYKILPFVLLESAFFSFDHFSETHTFTRKRKKKKKYGEEKLIFLLKYKSTRDAAPCIHPAQFSYTKVINFQKCPCKNETDKYFIRLPGHLQKFKGTRK